MTGHRLNIPKVITIGPDIEGQGGIASVLKVYRKHYSDFSYLPTNSRHGHVAGYFTLISTLARLPFKRLAGYDTIHAHGASGKSFMRKRLVLRWAQFLGFRTIFHCHGGNFREYAARTGTDRMKSMLSGFDAVACLSEKWRRIFSEELGCPKAKIVQNIVEPPSEPKSPALPKPGEALRLLFLGKIGREKGIYELVHALSILKEKGIAVRLTVGGTGDEESMRRAAEANGVDDMIDYAGWVEGEDKDRLLETHHILVLPSYIEGLPICLLEAGTAAMPAIATPVGAVTELIHDGVNGSIVPVGDSKALAEAIESYAADPSLIERQGIKAGEVVRGYYPDAVRLQLDRLYKSLTPSDTQ